MQEQIIYYKDVSFLKKGEETLDSYFEYVLAGSDLKVVRAKDASQLAKLLSNPQNNLLLCYMGNRKTALSRQNHMLSVLSDIRGATVKPVLAVYEAKNERYCIKSLAAGADDFCDIDCPLMELMVRIKTQLQTYYRLTGAADASQQRKLKLRGLEVDDVAKQVMVDGKIVKLTPLEYKILYYLMQQKGHVLSNRQIYQNIWHMEPLLADNTIAVHIRHLREKIEEDPKQPKWVQVVWGQGYKVC